MFKSGRLSIRQKVRLILFALITPLILYLIISNMYIIWNVKEEIAKSYRNGLQMYKINLETEMKMVEAQMAIAVNNDISVQMLGRKLNQYDYQNYSYNVLQTFEGWLSLYLNIAAFGILSETNDRNRFLYNDSNINVDLKYDVQQYFKDGWEELESERSWFVWKVRQTPFLARMIGRNGTYMVCLINLETLPTIEIQEDDESGIMIFRTAQEVLTCREYIEENHIVPKDTDQGVCVISGDSSDFMMISENLNSTDVRISYIIRYHVLIRSFRWVVSFLLLLSAMMFLLCSIAYWMLRRVFFYPVDNLVNIMNCINAGETKPDYDAYSWDEEFLAVINTFQNMMVQIENLQRISRQREMEKKQAEVQYLQQQIRPHFFLNCLKNIYSLVNKQNYAMIERIILLLSDYFRSIMLDNTKMVPIKKELDHVKSYVSLEELLSGRKIDCQYSVELSLLNKYIPPISILTFVENAVKYGYSDDLTLNLSITVKSGFIAGEKRICVLISDKGKGFGKEETEMLNAASDLPGDHIGIHNVRKRFEITFGDKSTFRFMTDHGAVIEFSFPVVEQESIGE